MRLGFENNTALGWTVLPGLKLVNGAIIVSKKSRQGHRHLITIPKQSHSECCTNVAYESHANLFQTATYKHFCSRPAVKICAGLDVCSRPIKHYFTNSSFAGNFI
jgi:hypothetical protein